MDTEHYARQLVNRLTIEGYTAYYARGMGARLVMRHPSSDIDIATNAPPEKILDLFPPVNPCRTRFWRHYCGYGRTSI